MKHPILAGALALAMLTAPMGNTLLSAPVTAFSQEETAPVWDGTADVSS